MDKDTTIMYYTDNSLDPQITAVCRYWLLGAAGDMPIVCVSQVPTFLDDGVESICVGQIGRSWLSLHKQLLAGLEAVKTKYVAMAEHDCIYSLEHFRWKPPRDDIFYYNNNMWLVQWMGNKPEFEGMYSFWPKRFALSQLVCNRDLLLRTIDRRLGVIDSDRELLKRQMVKHIGEPGFTQAKLDRLQKYASGGSSRWLRPLLVDFVEHLENEKAELFKTKTPNLDIRHKNNFTGPRRGRRRTWDLPPWGSFKEVIEKGNSQCL